jgi:protein TonB
VIEMTPNASLRADYEKYLYVGLLAAVLIHAAAFAFWPEYVPSQYRLRKVKFVFVEEVVEITVPLPPKEIDPPVEAADIISSDDVSPDITIRRNYIPLRDMLRIPPPPVDLPTFPTGGFDTYPEVIREVHPVYPDIARKAEVEGLVVVLVAIDETGNVIEARIGHSDAEVFNQAALDAALEYAFRPAEQNGFPVKATISLTFKFVLRD